MSTPSLLADISPAARLHTIQKILTPRRTWAWHKDQGPHVRCPKGAADKLWTATSQETPTIPLISELYGQAADDSGEHCPKAQPQVFVRSMSGAKPEAEMLPTRAS